MEWFLVPLEGTSYQNESGRNSQKWYTRKTPLIAGLDNL